MADILDQPIASRTSLRDIAPIALGVVVVMFLFGAGRFRKNPAPRHRYRGERKR